MLMRAGLSFAAHGGEIYIVSMNCAKKQSELSEISSKLEFDEKIGHYICGTSQLGGSARLLCFEVFEAHALSQKIYPVQYFYPVKILLTEENDGFQEAVISGSIKGASRIVSCLGKYGFEEVSAKTCCWWVDKGGVEKWER